MYHIKQTSQQKIQTNLNKHPNYYYNHDFNTNDNLPPAKPCYFHIFEQIEHLPATVKQVILCFWNKREHAIIPMKIGTIAEQAGCSRRTVTAVTNKLHELGILFKQQPTHSKYLPNNFSWGPNSFQPDLSKSTNVTEVDNLNFCTPIREDIYINKSSIQNKVYEKSGFSCCNKPIREDYSEISNCNNTKESGFCFEKATQITKPEERMDKKKREVVDVVAEQLAMSPRQKLKLSMYPIEAIQEAKRSYYSDLKQGRRKSVVIRDRCALFFYKANEYCKAQGISIDWASFFLLAEQLELDLSKQDASHSISLTPPVAVAPPRGNPSFANKPIEGSIKTERVKNIGYSAYDRWSPELQQATLTHKIKFAPGSMEIKDDESDMCTIQKRIAQLESSIKNTKESLKAMGNNPFLAIVLEGIAKKLAEEELELAQLRRTHEREEICN